MIKRVLFCIAALMTLSGVTQAAMVVRGEVVPVTAGFSGTVDIGIFAESDINTTLTGYNLPLGIMDPPATFAGFSAIPFGFGTEVANPLANPPFTASFGLGGAVGNVALAAGQSTQIGTVTFNVTNAPEGITDLGMFVSTGVDANFFTASTTEGTLNAANGLLTIAAPALSISAPTAVPEPSSLAALGALGLFAGAARRRRNAKTA